MGKLTNQILGNVSGSMGDLTFTKWREETIIKGKIQSRKKAPSNKQAVVREKFKQMGALIKAMRPVISLGYRMHKNRSPENLFNKENFSKLSGQKNSIEVNYPALTISSGEADGVIGITKSVSGRKVTINWQKEGLGKPEDKIILIGFNLKWNRSIINDEHERSKGTGELTIPAEWSGISYIYLFARNETTKKASETYFAGKVIL